MLLRDVQLLAIAEHRLICLNLSEAARTLPCDLDIAAMDGAKPPCRKRIRRGFDPAAVGDAIGVDAGDHLRFRQPDASVPRSDARRVGQECVSTCRFRLSPDP